VLAVAIEQTIPLTSWNFKAERPNGCDQAKLCGILYRHDLLDSYALLPRIDGLIYDARRTRDRRCMYALGAIIAESGIEMWHPESIDSQWPLGLTRGIALGLLCLRSRYHRAILSSTVELLMTRLEKHKNLRYLYSLHGLLRTSEPILSGLFQAGEDRERLQRAIDTLRECVVRLWAHGENPQNEGISSTRIQWDALRLLRLSIGVLDVRSARIV